MKSFIKKMQCFVKRLIPEERKIVQHELDFEAKEGVHNISDKGIKFIAAKEGFSSQLYNDIADHCTIGYGYLIHHGRCNDSISEKPFRKGLNRVQAIALLKQKLQRYVTAVNAALKVPQKQYQFDALVSLAYNIGTNGFINSSCIKRINNKAPLFKIEERWKVWNKIRDPKTKKLVVSFGLENRRRWEWGLYFEGKYGSFKVSNV